MDAIVLGAGFVGLGAALALQARGRSVALFDRRAAPGAETSFGPTGIVQSEAVYPYTFPRKPTEIVAAAGSAASGVGSPLPVARISRKFT